MPTRAAFTFVLLTAGATAATPSAPSFDHKWSGPPPLSLSQSIADGTLRSEIPSFASPMPDMPAETPSRRSAPPIVARLPIIEPRNDVDYRMVVKAPDPQIDFKMVVKEPQVQGMK